MYSIGLMSGTSMDGIEAALIETDGTPNLLKPLGHISMPYSPRFKVLIKAAEYAVREGKGDLEFAKAYYTDAVKDYLKNELGILETKSSSISLEDVIQHSTELHGIAVKKLLNQENLSASQIDVVGYHGQTLYHHPEEKISIIVGNGQQLANDLGITVVNDFRSQDIAAGGQGAPFAPLYHYALAVRDDKVPVAVVNCGGISNISLILNKNEAAVIGFDTGPGNALIDRLVRQRTKGQENMDTDGHYGKQGRVDKTILDALIQKSIIKFNQNYLLQSPPKSLDYGDMVLIPELEVLSIEDACATLETFTSETIVNSLDFLSIEPIDYPKLWILAGGGWHNPVIVQALKTCLLQKIGKGVQVKTADEAGWNSQAMEAQIFAYFAVRSLKSLPLSVPGTTGVAKPLSGGTKWSPFD